MPYSNIVFVKLFLSLFEEDDRFLYQLNESQQLLYVKMLYMAGTTNNHIPKNINFICNKLNYHHESNSFLADIERIKTVFPNGFIEDNGFYKFRNFNTLHNYIGKHEGTPKENPKTEKGVARIREEEEKNKSGLINDFPFLKDNAFKTAYMAFLEMRKKMGKEATQHAEVLLLKKLHKDKIDIAIKRLEQSIENSWQGIFPLKEYQQSGGSWKKP